MYCSHLFVPLHPASRAVIFGWTRQPSIGSHGGQYDVEDLTNRMQYQTSLNIAEVRINLDESQVLTSKTFQIMQQHIYYIRYALQFADMQIPELVNTFNQQVQSRAWSSMRAYHDKALLNEFQRRGIDTSGSWGRFF